MRAVVLHETGGPDRLVVGDVPEPDTSEGLSLVDVHACGINFLDVLIRQGRYPQMPELPYVPGVEVAGEVDGRRVAGLPRHQGGGYAERVLVPADALVELPGDATFEEGAAFLMTFLTAWLPLTRQVRVGEGATVLVHAAAGGVGSAAIQVARHLGARVVATASTAEKRRTALDLGAEAAYGYHEFGERVRADVVVDPVGGDVFAASLRVVEQLGAIVAIGFAGGLWQPVDPALLVGRNVSVVGFYLGRLMARAPHVVREALGELLPLWRDGTFKPLVGATFPLERAADAHRLIEERRHVGKVVLVP